MTNMVLAIVLFTPIVAIVLGALTILIAFKLDQDMFDDDGLND